MLCHMAQEETGFHFPVTQQTPVRGTGRTAAVHSVYCGGARMLQRSGFPSALNSVRISKGPRGRDKITGSLKRSLMTGVFTKHGQRTEKPFQIVSWATNITNRRLGSGRAAW